MQPDGFWRNGLVILATVTALCVGPMASAGPETQTTIATTADATESKTLTATVRKITTAHGNLITTLQAKDLSKLGITVGQDFTLLISESRYVIRYGTLYEDVPKGAWVAVAKDGGFIWIARNGENAATTVKAVKGTTLQVMAASVKP